MPATPPRRSATQPRDQAHGLRQIFAGADQRIVPLVHNPHVPGAGAVMEQLCGAFSERDLHTLVVDAADSASTPHELAGIDLPACIDRLSSSVSYLAARGLAMQYLDNRATLSGFLDALRVAAPYADVVLLHAGALDLRRMFAGRAPSPVLLVGNRPDSLTHAYSSMKLLSQRLGALAYDLVIAGDIGPRRSARIAERLTECADHFLGAALRHVVELDPRAPPGAAVRADLRRMATGQAGALPVSSGLSAQRPPSPRLVASGRMN